MDFAALAHLCAPWVAPATMAALVKTESAFQPLAIAINGGAHLQRPAQTTEEAVVTAKWLIAQGYSIDLGLGQINSANLARTGLSVEDAFDPCKNLAAAAQILSWNYQAAKSTILGEQAALQAALSAYNTGSLSRGIANGYVNQVISNTPSAAPTAMPLSAPTASPPSRKIQPQTKGPEAENPRYSEWVY